MDFKFCFFIPIFGEAFLYPLQALLRQLRHFNPNAPIFVATLPSFATLLNQKLELWGMEQITLFQSEPIIDEANDWHPVVWLKLCALSLDTFDAVIVLDLDVLAFTSVTPLLVKFLESNAIFAGSSDDDCFHQQFNGPLEADLQPFADHPAFNAGAFICRPSAEIAQFSLVLAKKLAPSAKFPEQAVLNATAVLNGGWLDLGDEWMLAPFSKTLDQSAQVTTFAHLWTPRPDFFGLQQTRRGEIGFDTFLQQYYDVNQKHFPESYLRSHFERYSGIT